MNKKMYHCWLNIEEASLFTLSGEKPAPSLTVRRCDVFMLATRDASNGH